MKDILNLLKNFNIETIFADTDVNGFCLIDTRTIFVNCNLGDFETIEVILHEAKHILSHKDYMELYRASFIFHSKFENEANEYMIDSLIKENNGAYDYTGLIETFKIGIGYDTKYQRRIQ